MARFYVVGAGRLGTGLALALLERGHTLAGAFSPTSTHDARTRALLGITPSHDGFGQSLQTAEWVFVTTRDDAISEVGQKLVESGLVQPGTVVAHASGCLPAQTLGRMPGVKRASLHPVVAVPDPKLGPKLLLGATYTVEGEANPELCSLVATLSGTAIELSAAQKPRYHAALVMAANLGVVLLDVARREAAAAGFDTQAAQDAVGLLAVGALQAAVATSPEEALTGPLARADSNTLQKHVAALSPQALEIYRTLSLAARPLLQTRGMTADVIAQLTQSLEVS